MSDAPNHIPPLLRTQKTISAIARFPCVARTGRQWCERIERMSGQTGLSTRLVSGGDSTTDFKIVLTHARLGEAGLAMRGEIPESAFAFSPVVDEDLRDAALSGRTCDVAVGCKPASGNLLRDKKTLFSFLYRVMYDDAIIAFDPSSTLLWTPGQLGEECQHDADLDIESLYLIHAVTASDGKPHPDDSEEDDEDKSPRCEWLHTHGLGELGGFDIDILRPHPTALASGDIIRSMAFAIMEGELRPDTEEWHAFHPNGVVRLVPAGEFHRLASHEDAQSRELDESHTVNRSVLCDPLDKKSRLMTLAGARGVRSARCFQRALPESLTSPFSMAATELMARRARGTLSLAAEMTTEFEDFFAQLIVKVGVLTDTARKNKTDEREHMWFEVDAIKQGTITCTLLNQPFDIRSMKQGGEYSCDEGDLTDWSIHLPMGTINPRSASLASMLRSMPEEIRRDIAQKLKESMEE